MKPAIQPACRVCGCTQFHACEGGCWWVEANLCSACSPEPKLVLSIQQPWAWLIVTGEKDIENRDWQPAASIKKRLTESKNRFYIHAGKKIDREAYDDMTGEQNMPAIDELLIGGIVGMATLDQVVISHPSPWFYGRYGFVLKQARSLPFRPLRGQLGFFEIPTA